MPREQVSQSQVLIVDDDNIFRGIARRSLERAGIAVSEAGTGVEGVDAFRQLQPEIVLLDVMMPEMDGYAACRSIRALPGGDAVPVVMITSLEDVDSINQAYEAGATDFITKPIEMVILVQRLRYMLRGVRLTKERNQLEKRLLQAQKLEAVGTLASGIGHDFMNLIQIILGATELLMAEKNGDDPDYPRLEAILDASKMGVAIGRQMLSCSRQLDTVKKRIDLNSEILNVYKVLQKSIGNSVDMRVDLDENLPPVDADAGQIGQVLVNLAKNASDAMPNGGKLVFQTASVNLSPKYCRSYPNVDPGAFVRISVADSGEGMPEETREKIFDPFFTTKPADRGTGLGLSMAYGIIQNHGGLITCQSTPGEGALFQIFLPVAGTPLNTVRKKDANHIKSGSETILLVDDVAQIRHFAQRFLKKGGYDVMMAEDGEQALALYREHKDRISLILLDLVMPRMGGEDCLQELLKINPDVKVIICSANEPKKMSREKIAEQSCGFIFKPYMGQDLLKMVRKTLENG